MPRSSRRRASVDESDADESVGGPVASEHGHDANMDDDDDDDSDDERLDNRQSMAFSSQLPDCSQDVRAPKDSAKAHLLSMNEETREKDIADITRHCLFRALAGLPIQRSDCSKHISSPRTTDAVIEQVNLRLSNMFGLELRAVPAYMQNMKNLPKKHKERYYAINCLHENEEEEGIDEARAAEHSKQIHSVHTSSAVEKGLLMVVLALTYCKGDPISDGSRWILDADLYVLLHHLDENIPNKPPSNTTSSSARRQKESTNNTPNVDVLLARWVELDYLVKLKASQAPSTVAEDNPNVDMDSSHFYSMGPRAAIEIGRLQIIYFCAEVLDEDGPDPTMLAEISQEGDEEEAPTQAAMTA